MIQYSFSIIEGQTFHQIIQNLQSQSYLTPISPSEMASITQQLNIEAPIVEGWLYPDTYFYSKGDSAMSILSRASIKMKKLLQELWEFRQLGLPYDNAYQALIMASIIEKETGIASEREQIAGVFVRRLRLKMRLGTDPTVIYGIGPDFNGDITRKDLRTHTPYNTYMIKGLPPTPIAMPSKHAYSCSAQPCRWQNTILCG